MAQPKKLKMWLIVFTFIYIFGHNFLVEIHSVVFWMPIDLNVLQMLLEVNAFFVHAIIKP